MSQYREDNKIFQYAKAKLIKMQEDILTPIQKLVPIIDDELCVIHAIGPITIDDVIGRSVEEIDLMCETRYKEIVRHRIMFYEEAKKEREEYEKLFIKPFIEFCNEIKNRLISFEDIKNKYPMIINFIRNSKFY